MQFSAAQIAELIQGRIEGDPNTLVNSFGKIEEEQLKSRARKFITTFKTSVETEIEKLNKQLEEC